MTPFAHAFNSSCRNQSFFWDFLVRALKTPVTSSALHPENGFSVSHGSRSTHFAFKNAHTCAPPVILIRTSAGRRVSSLIHG